MPSHILYDTLQSSNGLFPLVVDSDLKGGFRVVADQTALLGIASAKLTTGMWVFRVDNLKVYRYNGGSTGTVSDWTEISFGSPFNQNLNTTDSVTFANVSGNGSGLTNLNATNISSGTVSPARLGTGTADNTTYLRGDGVWAIVPPSHIQNTDTGTTAISFQIDTGNSGPRIKNIAGVLTVRNSADTANAALTASAFVGDGSGLTGLTKSQVGLSNVQNIDTTNAANISSGILPGARFDDTTHGNRSGGTLHAVATTTVAGFMSATDKATLNNVAAGGVNPFNQSLNTTDNVVFNTITGNGSALTGLTKTQVGLGNVQNVDTTNAANITSGILSPARMGTGTADSTTYLRGDGTWQTVPINHTQNTDTGTTATSFQIDTGNSGPRIKNISGVLTVRNAADTTNSNLTAAAITGTTFTGDGSALTGLTKGQVGLGNVANVDTTNAANISSGVLPAGRFDDTTHGNRSGGTLHAVATTSVAGFMSSADKTSLGTVAAASHTQNTDTGTTATSFQIDTGNTGPRIKNISGIMTVRNAADSANAALTASAFVGDGSGLTGLTKAQVGLGNVTNVDTTNAANISSGILPAARFDDTTHGNRSGGTLHAVATTSVAGFMSAADKTSLGTVAAASHAQNTDTGTTATSFQIDTGNTGPKIKNVAGIITIRNAADSANAALTALAFTGDGSALTGLTKGQVGLGNVANVDTTNAANISSGILPAGRFDDTTHGNRSGGTLHAVASHTVAGFMSASDKTTLDNIVASGVNPFDQSLNTTDAVNFAGLNVDGDTTTDNLNINGQISFGGGNVIHATQLGIELDPAGNQVSVGGTLFVSYEVTASSYFGDGSNLTGLTKAQVNLGNVANVDTTNAANISSGILPAGRFNDTTHGNRSGGTLHALATESVAGFMSAADKTALDTMISNGVNPFDQDLNTYDDVSFNSVATPSVTLIGPVAPVLNFVGDGTGFTTSTAGIQFDGSKNYFFGIGSNLASPAILVQSNGFVNIPHVGFGYLGTFDDSTFGRTEGAKVAMRFGNVSGDPGIDIFDYAKVYQSIDHGFSPMLNVRGSTNIVGILTTKGAGNGIQIQNADNTTALNIQAEFGGAGSNGPIGFYSQNNRAMAFKNGRVVIDPSSNYTDNGVQALQVNGGIKAGPSEFGDGSGYTYISNLIAYEGVRIQPGSHSAYAISSQEYGTLKYQNNFGGQQFVGGDSINTNVSSGIFKFLEAIPEFKQSGTAGYIAFDINPTETTVGSGTKLLQRWAANNTQKASIDNGGNLILGGNLVAIGSITGSYLNGDGSAITGLTKAQVGLGNVQNVDTTNASNITSGTLGTARMGTGTANSTTYLRGDGTWQTVPINHTQNTDTGTTATSFQIDTGNSGPRIKNVSGVITIRNAADSANAALTASAFVGDGSGLTGLTKGQVGLGNVANVDTTNAANISSGILPAGRFDDSTHGNRSGGTLHAVATTSVAGFMSAADKTALNNYVSTSGNPFNQSLNTTDNVHFHDVSMLGALNISSAVSTNFLTLTDSTNNGSVSFYFSNPIGSAGDLHISNSGARTFFDNYETIFSALRASSIQPYTSTDLVLMARGGQRGVLKTDNLNIEALTWQANQPVKITKYSSSIAALSVDGRTLLNGATDDTTTALQVNGGITSSSIKIATGTVNPINVNYTGPSSDSVINVSYLGTQVAFIRASGEYWGQSSTIVGNVQAGYFLGNGAGITSLNASNLASGTLPAARFDDTSHGSRSGGTLHAAATTSVAGFMSADDKMALDQIVLAGANPFDQDLNTTDSVTFENVNISSDLQVAGTIISSDLQTRNSVFHIVDSSSSPIATFNDPGSGIPAVEINGDISASGAFIADNGVVLNSDFDSNYIRFSSGTENGVEVAGTDFVHLRTNNNANGLTVDLTGTVTAEADLVVAGTISGDGSGLTGLTKAQIGLSNVQNVDTTNAANISSGILPGARFDDTTHGSRSGGTLHAVATTTVAGFMSAADKIALNTYIANSGNPFDQNLNTTNDVHFNSVTTTHDLNVGGNIVGVNAALSTAMTIGGVTYKNNGGLGTNTAITGQLGIVQKSTSPLLQLFSQGRLLGAANLLEFYNQDSSVGTYFDSQGQFYTSAYRFIGSSAQIYSPNGDGSIRINPSNGLQIDTGGVQTSINSQLIQHTTSATDSLGGGGYQVNFANNVTDTRWSALEVKSQGTTTFRVHPQGWSSQTGNSNVGGILTAGSLVGSGSGITSINAGNISSGTVSSARLGSGTANSTTYLRGDNTWQTIPNSHVQNTDTGTTATSFQIDSGNTGPRIKNISGVLTIRNAADSANAALTASAFTGDGSALTGITAAQVGALSLSGGTVNGVVSINGDFHYNSGNFFLATDRLNFANTAIFAASSTDVTLSSYSGGSGGTSVAQGFNNLSTGTKDGFRVESNDNTTGNAGNTAFKVNKLGTGTGTGPKLLADLQANSVSKFKVDYLGNTTALSFIGDGSALTGLTKAQVGLGNVQNVDTTNAANITSGIVSPARLGTGTADSTTYLRGDGTWQTVPINHTQNTDTGTTATSFQIDTGNSGPRIKNITGVLTVRNAADSANANLTAAVITATSFTGDGSALTGLTKGQVGLGNVANVDTTNAANISSGILPAARFDDSTHGSRSGGSLHAVATTSVAGFMSAADKTSLGTVTSASHTQNTDTGTTATSFQIDTGNTGPRIKNITGVMTVRNAADSANAALTASAFTGDGSALTGLTKGQVGLGNVANVDTTNAANISSGILPGARFDDTTHGNRSGGTLHAVATTSVAGFMSATDKTSLGTVAAASHSQNTDTGTNSVTFQIDTGNTGPKIKNIAGVITIRNAADTANAALTASAFTGDGSALTGLTKGQVGLGNVANVDTTNAANISSGILPAGRFDDSTHGSRSGGTLHALATTSVAGFMSATDKSSLDTLVTGSTVTNSYSATFNSTTDWGTASGGNYSITVNHNLNTFALSVNVWDETSGHLMTIPGVVSMPSANQVLISVPQSPDERFAGRIVILSSGGNAGSSPPVSNNAQTVVPKTFGMAIDGSGGIVATGTRGPRRPLAMTLTNWYIDTDVATTLSIDVYVNGSLISGTNPMTITAGTTNNSSTLTGWTTTIMQGDAVTFNVTSNTAAKNIIITMFGI